MNLPILLLCICLYSSDGIPNARRISSLEKARAGSTPNDLACISMIHACELCTALIVLSESDVATTPIHA